MSFDSSAGKRMKYSILIFVLILLAGLFFLNAVAERFINANAKKYSKYDIKAVSATGDIDYLVCHEWDGNPYFDFCLHEVKTQYDQIFNIGEESIDTKQPVKCVRHNFDATKIMTDLPFPEPKKEGDKRIVFIGDSFTYGEAVPKGTAYPEAINSYLRLLGNPGRWESVNFGIIGADIPFIYEVNFKNALMTNPDVIVYTWIANDIPSVGEVRDLHELNFLINERNMIIRSNGLPLLKLVKAALMNKKLTAESLQWYQEKNSPGNKEGIAIFRNSVAAMKREATDAGAEFYVVLFPILVGSYENYPLMRSHENVAEILAGEEIKYYDLTKDILKAPAEELWVCPANHHPNVFAHRLAAKALIKFFHIPTSYEEKEGKQITSPAAGIEPEAGVSNTAVRDGIPAEYDFKPGSVQALKEEIVQLPAGTRLITNSEILAEKIYAVSGLKMILDEKKGPPEKLCVMGTPCVYLYFVPDKIRKTIYLPDFDPPCISKMNFEEGIVFFMFPDDVTKIGIDS